MTSFNPFFHRGPIRDTAYFFDRSEEVTTALEMLAAGQSVSIVGPRRIGKTSLLLQLTNPSVMQAHGVDSESLCIAWLDCGGCRLMSPNELYTLIYEEIRGGLLAANLGNRVPLTETPVTFQSLNRAARLLRQQNIPVIVVFDEFDTLSAAPQLDHDVFSALRSLATSHSVRFLTASTQPLVTLCLRRFSSLSSPFFNFFSPLRLGLFSEVGARSLLVDLAARVGLTLEPEFCDELLTLAGPQPLFLQIAGYHAVECWRRNGGQLSAADLPVIRQRLIAEAEGHWAYAWHALAHDQQRLLALLPVLQRRHEVDLHHLVEEGLVIARSDAAAVPLSPALGEFVSRQHVDGLLQAPPVTIATTQRLAMFSGQCLSLSPVAFSLLTCLVEQAGQIVPHATLQERVWETPVPADDERFKAAVREIRAAFNGIVADSGKRRILNRPRIGYSYEPDR